MKFSLLFAPLSCQWASRTNQRPIPTYEEVQAAQEKLQSAHQGVICGDRKFFYLDEEPRQSMILESPFYPAEIRQQIQCRWVIEGVPGKRIKLTFLNFYMTASWGTRCQATYLSIAEPKSAATTFRLCGRNPGLHITSGPDLTIDLHSDGGVPDGPQRFKILLSVTNEPPSRIDKGEVVIMKDRTPPLKERRKSHLDKQHSKAAARPTVNKIQLKSTFGDRSYEYRPQRRFTSQTQNFPMRSSIQETSPLQTNQLFAQAADDDTSSERSSTIVIIVCIVGSLLGVFTLLLVLIWTRWTRTNKKDNHVTGIGAITKHES